MAAAAPLPDAPPLRAVPLAIPPLELRRALSMIGEAISDPRPFDPWRLDGRDPAMVRALLPLCQRISEGYLRAELQGLEHIARGPALYVANHNGGVLGPDLFCTLGALWRTLGPDAPLYALTHDLAMRRVTPLGRVLQRAGALRAHPEAARRALRSGGSVLVYPGGDLEAHRAFWRRDEIIFERGAGFVQVARDAGVPIIPIVAQGAHRNPLVVHEGAWLAGALGLRRWSRIERFPIALGLPWIVGAGPWVPWLPLPLRVRLRVLSPMWMAKDADPHATRARIAERMQTTLTELAHASGWVDGRPRA